MSSFSDRSQAEPQGHLHGIWARLAWLNTERLVVVLFFLGVFIMAARLPADTDTWWHIRTGQYIAETGGIPFSDPFSHTVQGKQWIDHGWLAQIGLFWTYRLGGLTGLGLGLAAVVVLIFAFIYLQCEGNVYIRVFALLLSALTSAVVWIARPQILSLLLASVFLYVLYLFKRRGLNRLWVIPLLFILWVNIHGGYIIGFILLGCYVVGELANNLIGVGAAPVLTYRRIGAILIAAAVSVLAVLANPNTYKMLAYPFFTVGIGALQDYIQEWGSPNFHLLYQQPFLWLLFAVLVVMALSRVRADFTDLALLLVFGYMSLLAGRNMALFALVAAPALTYYGPGALDNVLDAWRRRTPWGHWIDRLLAARFAPRPIWVIVNWTLLALVVLACLVKIYAATLEWERTPLLEKSLPVGAAEFISDNKLPGKLFNSYNWGGYLIWRLYPHYPVFVDGRTDLYDNEFLQRYLRVASAKGDWQETLDRYSVNTILVERDSALATVLAETTGWVPVYADQLAAVFVRDVPENHAWIGGHRIDFTP